MVQLDAFPLQWACLTPRRSCMNMTEAKSQYLRVKVLLNPLLQTFRTDGILEVPITALVAQCFGEDRA